MAARAVLMICDGLRPDYVTEPLMPHLVQLAAEGVRFADSHAVYPTVTRCNSASIATGLLPARHGIPSNVFYAPGSTATGRLNTGAATDLELLRPTRNGRVLHAPALAERVTAAGSRAAVVSTGSPGSALLQYPQAAAGGGIIFNPALEAGIQRAELETALGPMPARTMPNTAQNAWFTRVITDVLLPDPEVRFISFWHCDPDHTQHTYGVGHPETLQAVRDAGANLGVILAAIRRLGLSDETDVIVTSDHGFATITGGMDVAGELERAGVAEGAIILADLLYLPGSDAARLAQVAGVLQRMAGIGPIFTGARGMAVAPGTTPLARIGADGEHAPDLLFSPAWSDAVNAHGYPGAALSPHPRSTYAGNHGSISPWEVRNTLIAAGPSFKRGLVSHVPAGNIDIAPTLLHILGIDGAAALDGRVLTEALAGGPAPQQVAVERWTETTETDSSRQQIQFSRAGGVTYLDSGRREQP